MLHQTKTRKLGRKKDQRKALIKSLMSGLIKNEKIRTTEAKAKELRPKIEKLITRAMKKDLASRRILVKHLDKSSVDKIVNVIAPKYTGRKGGYTRITKLSPRKKDGSPMAIIEFV
jgi:large subunit ribosomal protein L17